MVLLTVTGDALFIWRKFISDDNQEGVNCAVFRNEGPLLSSLLILEAECLAWSRWPGERLYTYVWGAKVNSANAGYCFKCAGWTNVRDALSRPMYSKGKGLAILEKFPWSGWSI